MIPEIQGIFSKSAAESIDLAADFLVDGFEDETRRIKVAVRVPSNLRDEDEEEEDTSEDEEVEPRKSASLADCLMKIARSLVLPASIAAMVAVKEKDSSDAIEEGRNGTA